uniref:Flotillin n=1 Tax=Branchiostoma floridae TaxID=7739 RepID=C3YXN4_BRAFL|eukprot:XP_002598831.1 hypothetical protein BRAFLDRAFT_120729 [Branchiostoma floridae]
MGNIHTVGPSEALVVSGAKSRKFVTGGWAWAWWLGSDVQRLSLEVMTLNSTCDSVETAEGVPLTVTGVAHVKVITEPWLLSIACEQFLGKSVSHIQSVLVKTLEGHLRAILGTLTVEAVYKDRGGFAELVRDAASPDLGRMGIEILSFTITNVDRVE